MKQHGDTVAGKKIEFIRKDTGGIAPDVAKRLAQELVMRDKVDILGGLDADAERARGRRRLGRGQEVHGDHERRDLDHHHQVALHGAHLGDAAAAQPDARHLGGQEGRHQEGLHHGVRLRPRPRRRRRLPARVQGGRRRDRRLGALPGREPGLLRVRAARQGHQSGRDLHLDPGRHAAGGARQGARRARHRSEEDQDPRPGRAGRRQRAQEHGRHRARHHHRRALRLQPPVGEEQGVREGASTTITSATPTSSRSAATTACT